MINVITIDREYGAGAGDVAKKLAERLGWRLCDAVITDEIARATTCDPSDVACREERRDPLFYRFMKSFMRGTFENNPNAPQLRLLDADRVFKATERIITRWADRGHSIIVGRGGAYFLQKRSDAYHVFLYARREDKIERLRREGVSQKEAIEHVDTVDAERAAFIKDYFGVEWPLREKYHAMLNTRVGEDAVVDLILDGIKALEKAAR